MSSRVNISLSTLLKQNLPHALAVGIFLIVTFIYCVPVLQGYVLFDHDKYQGYAVGKDVRDHYEAEGKLSRWTNHNFGGMPATQVWSRYPSNLYSHFYYYSQKLFDRPLNFMLIYFLGAYLSLIAMRCNPYVSILGALAFGLCTYNLVIIEVGQGAKVKALGYAMPVLAGFYLILKRQYWKGFLLVVIFLGLNLRANHLQITYYLMVAVGIFVLFEVYYAIKDKHYLPLLRSLGLMVVAVVLAVLPNFSVLYPTYVFAKDTTRGQQVLESRQGVAPGNNKATAMDYSYAPLEITTFLIPNFMGGSSKEEISLDSPIYTQLIRAGVPPHQVVEILEAFPLYWGSLTVAMGPIYFGAIMLLLSVLGFFLLPNRQRWLLFGFITVGLMMAWGRYFSVFNDLMFDYLPFYRSFRAPSMWLSVVIIPVIWLGTLGLDRLLSGKITEDKLLKALYRSGAVLASLTLVLAFISPFFIDFQSNSYNTQTGLNLDQETEAVITNLSGNKAAAAFVMDAVRQERASALRSDGLRAFVFLILAIGLIWLGIKQKLSKPIWLGGLILLVLIDFWQVGKRYLNKEDFKPKSIMKFALTEADYYIMKDAPPHYRVLDLRENPWNNAKANYYHLNAGGYQAAKLRRYQDLIDQCLQGEVNQIVQHKVTRLPVLDMLNVRYVLSNNSAKGVIHNQGAQGWAWFVQDHQLVEKEEEGLRLIKDFQPGKIAIIHQRFQPYLEGFEHQPYPFASIKMIAQKPDEVVYQSISPVEQLAVFSEIYYKGNEDWRSYIDGVETPHFQANFVLRAMRVPAGVHEIRFQHRDQTYLFSEKIALGGSVLVVLLLLGALIKAYFQKS